MNDPRKPLADIQTLEEMHAYIRAFDGCDLKKGATQTVIYDGNPAAEVVVMGEAPGEQEDLQGKPFVGRSGKLMDQMLEAIGLSRKKNVYITNALFWRPPSNRTPTPAEIAVCRPIVQRHLALIKPRIILLAGRTAAQAVLQTEQSMGALRGKWQKMENPYLDEPLNVLVTFHPAYLLRNPPAKKDAWEDLKMVKKRMDEEGIV
ncbi:MAG TPA: uracil-DNA glycosylase [Alphaproteobacteria bacterium]|nr:uracil-DNA glycosylase [Alphaproteobacteria bacterium]